MRLSGIVFMMASLSSVCTAVPSSPYLKRDAISTQTASHAASLPAVSHYEKGSTGQDLLPVPRTHPARKATICKDGFEKLSHAVSLTYAQEFYQKRKHYGATVNFTTKYPAIVAGDYLEVVSLKCTKPGIFNITFSSKATFEAAKTSWTTPMIIITENVGSFKGNVGLQLNANGEVKMPFSKNLFTLPLVDWGMPDILDLGLYLKLVGSGDFTLSGTLQYTTGFNFSVGSFLVTLPLSNDGTSRSASVTDSKTDHYSNASPSAELSLKFSLEFSYLETISALVLGSG
ncbi:hypothetical protein P7C70_g6290, partial [Phenoliferia sp. Uapishka_3]